MEEEMLSLISTTKTDVISDESDANSSSFTYHAGDKRSRPYETDGSPGSGGGPKFKGVVPQQNGHWGAQIYANHQRIWLGTFKSEKEAATAYDSAAIKLRSGDSHRNFPWTKFSIQEPNFQDLYTAEAVLNMIKDGSYPSKFEDFLRTQTLREETRVGFNMVRVHGKERFLCTQLFQKELTPSDVGKLNRLVIPKKYAVKYFPHITDSEKENVNAGGVDDVLLIFYDRLMRSWKFRYCYWRSSQSFVFTRGWNRFVKEKDLKSKDIVSFYICEPNDKVKEGPSFFLIDVIYNQDGNNSRVIQGVNQFVEMNGILEHDFSQTINHGSDKDENEFEDYKDLEDDKVLNELETTPIEKKKCLRLFGVQIN